MRLSTAKHTFEHVCLFSKCDFFVLKSLPQILQAFVIPPEYIAELRLALQPTEQVLNLLALEFKTSTTAPQISQAIFMADPSQPRRRSGTRGASRSA